MKDYFLIWDFGCAIFNYC